MKKVLFIDGSSLIFRAFYAIRNLTTNEGLPTGAVYGFINMYQKAMDLIQPQYVLVAFDKGGPTLRTKEFADYKGTRQKTPDELKSQFGIVRDLLDSYGVKHLALDDYEADDIIGTLSKQASESGMESYMLTGDKDYFQLVDENAKVLYTVKGISNLDIYDIEKVAERYDGLKPKDLIEVKALMGDASDNIPGVPGVGEKTAIKLIKEYKKVEGIYENIDKISGKALPQKLIENEALAFMSRKLGTIYVDVDLEIGIEDIKLGEANRQELYEKYKALEFSSLMREFAPNVDEADDLEIEYIELEELISDVKSTKKLVFDIANEGDYIYEKPKYIAMLGKEKRVTVINFEDLNQDKINSIKELFENADIKKIGFDIKKAIVMLEKLDINFKDNYQDLMIMDYLLNPNSSYTIQDVGLSEMNMEIKSLEDYIGKGRSKKTLDEIDYEELKEYLANHVVVLDGSVLSLEEKIEQVNMTEILNDIDLPLVKVLSEMELIGVEAHIEEFEKLDEKISKKLNIVQEKIYEYAETEFNINSPKQLGEILFDKLNLPVIKKTKTGYSTNAEVLKKLEGQHEIIPLIEEYRQIAKIKSTYIDGLIPMIDEDGRIHAKFNQTVAATGRLSSTEPNLQNIPIKTEEGRLIRSAFFAGKGKKLVAADYSQIELRVLAALTKDENMLSAFKDGIDIHTKTASEVFNVDLDKVTSNQRSAAKAVNFGIVYGISDYGLSEDLNITRKQAKQYIDGYLSSYPEISKYMKDIVEQAKEKGYVESMFGRRRTIPEISSSNFNLRSFGERIALNSPIQGTAADIIKIAMNNVYNRLKDENLQSKLILQIHDELIIEALESELDIVEKIIVEEMQNAVDIGVDLLVEVESGDTWYEV